MARMGTNEARETLRDVIDTAHRHPESRRLARMAGHAGNTLALMAGGFGFDRTEIDYIRTEVNALVWQEMAVSA